MADKGGSEFGAAPALPAKHKRRRPVPGEDLPALKNVVKEIQKQVISLEDFLLLISPHTGDKGVALTQVMTEDLQLFRKMVIKIYDTTTQDITDVITNEQLELAKTYAERQQMYIYKMMRALQEIEDRAPGFDFKQYYQDPTAYLNTLFKLADIPDEEEVDAARRQLAYHRSQWLRAEGERLQAENNKLQERLNTLKKIQRQEIADSINEELEVAKKKEQLEKQQAAMQNKLDELSDALDDTIVSEKSTAETKKGEQVKAIVKKKKQSPKQVSFGKDATKEDRPKPTTEITTSQIVETVTETSESKMTLKSRMQQKIASKKPRQPLRGKPPFETGAEESTTTPAEEVVPKALTKRRVEKKKKRVQIKDRPAWQDVEIEENIATQDIVETPIDIFGATAPPASSATRPSAPPSRPRQTEQPQVPGSRAAGPRDTWGGFY